MPRKPKVIPGPSRLSKILANFNRLPRPHLNNVASLKMTMAFRNDHFGARHFLKDELPRIQYMNPNLQVEVTRKRKSPNEIWKPEMVLQLRNGATQTLDLEGKWSSKIFEELMDIGGGANWSKWKRERLSAGLPLVEVPQSTKAVPKAPTWVGEKKNTSGQIEEIVLDPSKTGAAAVLP